MNVSTTIPHRAVAILAAVAVSAVGCGGCETEVLDRIDEWVQDDPERPGKVGTYRALDVVQTARTTADTRARRGEGPCRIGWRLDEPFILDYEFEITVGDGLDDESRHWRETGQWQQDEAGDWMIDARAEFADEESVVGERVFRVFRDDEGLREWLGPEVVARYEPESVVEKHWRREFGGRFAGLARMISESWQPDDSDPSLWVPGGDPLLCGPVERSDEAGHWRPHLEARATRVGAEMTRADSDDSAGGEEKKCRRLDATYELGGGEQMGIAYRECIDDPPGTLKRPATERSVDVRRDRQRSRVVEQLREWTNEGLIDRVEKDETGP